MLQCGIDVSRETGDRLEALVSTLERWQKTINLVSRTTMGDVWRRHVLDSAQLKPLIPAGAKTLVDLGSGAGFPGLVVAALRPDLAVTLIESDARKAAFLGEAARRMMLEKAPKIVIGRIEAVAPTSELPHDDEWERELSVVIGPNPALDDSRKRILASPRRYETIGPVRLTLAYGLITVLYVFGIPLSKLASIYERMCCRTPS